MIAMVSDAEPKVALAATPAELFSKNTRTNCVPKSERRSCSSSAVLATELVEQKIVAMDSRVGQKWGITERPQQEVRYHSAMETEELKSIQFLLLLRYTQSEMLPLARRFGLEEIA
jgi:hypothetical protein